MQLTIDSDFGAVRPFGVRPIRAVADEIAIHPRVVISHVFGYACDLSQVYVDSSIVTMMVCIYAASAYHPSQGSR